MSFRFVALCVTFVAPHAMAEDTSVGREVHLNCPTGTVQRGTQVSKDLGVFCVKSTGSEKGSPHGPYVDFWANGQKQAEGQYKDGFRTGLWTFYDANGVKTGQTQFEANDYHGQRVQFHPNGAKKMEQTWVKGSREGVEATYTADGQKVSEVRYSADKPVVSK
ncbi:toxin-antitoxin system YwqK family antitoxin [Myxococcus fulvus]|uniref:toxin-antitoxin system YwqK family antitoxin n=1 Tax=Myxococcus fulvus TaxID=33 RepID=UPI003B9DC342